jgi:hypothetical protein
MIENPATQPHTVYVYRIGETEGVNLPITWNPLPREVCARQITRSGYTTKRGVPCGFTIVIGGRTYRPRVVCYSNMGSTFIQSDRFVDTLVCGTMIPHGKPSSAEDVQAWEARIIRPKDA